MKVIYTTEYLEQATRPAIFLAGPSPRGNETVTWRPEAEQILADFKFEGTVFNPEQRTVGCIDFSKVDYPADWEHLAINKSDVLLFWVPRELSVLPAFTTNIEFGYFIAKGSPTMVYGRPDNAPKNRYLDWLWNKDRRGQPIYKTLKETIAAAIIEIDKKEAERLEYLENCP